MNGSQEQFGKWMAILAFVFCFGSGIWILTLEDIWSRDTDGLYAGFGLYFIGKAFFVGPMLYIASRDSRTRQS